MELEILRDEKNELEFRIKKEDHTLANLLYHQLLENKEVEVAQYDIPHPQVGAPTFFIRMKKGSAVSAVERALKEIQEQAESLKIGR
ncbi:DNA-directed RNA polymerase subunit L [archaeon]|nr:DNA-directed RNA polymerase subunit L [archaeon]